MTKKFGLVFTEDVDDFEELEIAVAQSPVFGIIGLIRYRNVQFVGTAVYVDVRVDLGSTRDAVVAEFGLKISDIEWVSKGWPRESTNE
ncbi:MAG: hypothetical protein HOV94_37190 [Saccharothrix sp.]|nr:hypothetical protein [Saccharothrix sp.]